MTEAYQYIDTPEALQNLARRLGGSPWLCLDTEFMREKNYYPQLCLLQVANAEEIACVDPLALPDLDPLLEVLYDPATVKVLHAAKQDLEILYHLRGTVPQPIFDTQIAAALLCHNEQIGYANLVEQSLGVRLDKAHTRTDWSLRPLDSGQLRYAADDVRYLRQIYQQQLNQLREQGRLEWLREDFEALSDPAHYAPDPEQSWRRVKDAKRLKPRQLAVLKALAEWRERRAMELDKPRRWILRDEVLTELARAAPDARAGLERIRGLEPGTIKRVGDRLLQVIAAGGRTPREQWPELEPRLTVKPEQEAVVDLLMALLRMRAREHELSPAMLSNRHDLERLLNGDRDVAVLHGWRRALVGTDLQALLDGRLRLGVADGAAIAGEA
jgi:ribonuclease D